MSSLMPRDMLGDAATLGDGTDTGKARVIMRNGQEIIFLCHTVVLFDNPHGNVHQHNVGFHACLLSLGHNPQLTVK